MGTNKGKCAWLLRKLPASPNFFRQKGNCHIFAKLFSRQTFVLYGITHDIHCTIASIYCTMPCTKLRALQTTTLFKYNFVLQSYFMCGYTTKAC